ncbi:hypothetical protein Mapa_012852 [Marchantia paleacea]|nr:hypothetical protein Mapa_012852 [Marchantia paleacea]
MSSSTGTSLSTISASWADNTVSLESCVSSETSSLVVYAAVTGSSGSASEVISVGEVISSNSGFPSTGPSFVSRGVCTSSGNNMVSSETVTNCGSTSVVVSNDSETSFSCELAAGSFSVGKTSLSLGVEVNSSSAGWGSSIPSASFSSRVEVNSPSVGRTFASTVSLDSCVSAATSSLLVSTAVSGSTGSVSGVASIVAGISSTSKVLDTSSTWGAAGMSSGVFTSRGDNVASSEASMVAGIEELVGGTPSCSSPSGVERTSAEGTTAGSSTVFSSCAGTTTSLESCGSSTTLSSVVSVAVTDISGSTSEVVSISVGISSTSLVLVTSSVGAACVFSVVGSAE